MTCINFIPWDGKTKDFLLIWPMKYPRGCWSFVGRIGGPQLLSLQPPDRNGANCLGTEGRSMHEIMHALGIFHEQSRADRDYFVKVNWKNIIKGKMETSASDLIQYIYIHIVHILIVISILQINISGCRI